MFWPCQSRICPFNRSDNNSKTLLEHHYNSNKLTPVKDILSVTYDAGSQSLLNVKIPFQILREFYFLFIIIYLQIQHFRYILSICFPLSQSET